MCIIAAKPSGVDIPSEQAIFNMFYNNDDGAGFMYAAKGKVFIEKGFMKYDELVKRLEELGKQYDLKKLSLVMHFRITTHGGTKPENCHPFPVTDSVGMLQKRKSTAKLGVAHNGIIPIHPKKDISDTMEYIASQLAPLQKAVPEFYKNKHLLQMIENATDGSRLAFMTSRGDIYTVGDFVEDKGVLYSNDSYASMYGWRGLNSCYSLGDYGYGNYDSKDQYIWNDIEDGCSDEGLYYVSRLLMWLNEDEGEFVIDPEGNLCEAGDFAIDRECKVYCWDYDEGMMALLPGFRAYTVNGTALRFDPQSDLTMEEYVVC